MKDEFLLENRTGRDNSGDYDRNYLDAPFYFFLFFYASA
jgi:hypothetical protein